MNEISYFFPVASRCLESFFFVSNPVETLIKHNPFDIVAALSAAPTPRRGALGWTCSTQSNRVELRLAWHANLSAAYRKDQFDSICISLQPRSNLRPAWNCLMEFPVVSTRGSLSHSISRRACSMHIICEVWVCGLPMLGRQPWTGGDEQSAPFRHHTQFRQTLADLCPSFLCFWCWRELTQKIEKSGSDTRLGYVSVPLDDIISPAISLASFFDWPSAQLEQYSGWFAGSVNDWSWQFRSSLAAENLPRFWMIRQSHGQHSLATFEDIWKSGWHTAVSLCLGQKVS